MRATPAAAPRVAPRPPRRAALRRSAPRGSARCGAVRRSALRGTWLVAAGARPHGVQSDVDAQLAVLGSFFTDNSCAEQMLFNEVPRVYFGPIDSATLEHCVVAQLTAVADTKLVLGPRTPVEVFEMFRRFGEVQDVHSDPQVVATMAGLGEPWTSFGRHCISMRICMPRGCEAKHVHLAIYLVWVLRLPHLAMHARAFLEGDPVMLALGKVDDIAITPEQPVMDAETAAKEVATDRFWQAMLEFERTGDFVRARMASLARLQDKLKNWDTVLRDVVCGREEGACDGFEERSLLDMLVLAHMHFANRPLEERQRPQLLRKLEGHDVLALTEDAARVLDWKDHLLAIGADLGIEHFQDPAARTAMRFGWPVKGRSTATRVFTHVQGEVLPVYRMRNVCVRDLARETEFSALGGSISTGRRLELLTVGLPGDAAAELDRRPLGGRVVLTHLEGTDRLAEYVRGRSVEMLPGESVFLFDGHKSSARCPDCANVEHAFVDDLLLELAAWYRSGGVADQFVLNALGSAGGESPKRWFDHLVRRVAGAVPVLRMHAGEMYCFHSVIINLHPCPYSMEDEGLLWRDGALAPDFSMGQALAWVRERIWTSVSPKPEQDDSSDFALFARAKVFGVKRRRWLGYKAIAHALGAREVEFEDMSFDDEVRAMRGATVFATVPGAHHAAVLFMRPGAAWVELHCPAVAGSFYWYRGFRRLTAALGVRFEVLEAADCPGATEVVDARGARTWVDVEAHPFTAASRFTGHQVVGGHGQLCAFKPPASGASKLLPQGAKNLPLEAQLGLDAALKRCLAWESDCNGVHPLAAREGWWDLVRTRHGDWRKDACAELVGGRAALVDRTRLVAHSLYDADLRAPDDAVPRIRGLLPGSRANIEREAGAAPPAMD